MSGTGDTASGGLAAAMFTNTLMVTSDTFDPHPSDNVLTFTLSIGGPTSSRPSSAMPRRIPDSVVAAG